MNRKRELLETLHQALQSDFNINTPYQTERNIILKLRNLLEDSVIMSKDDFSKMISVKSDTHDSPMGVITEIDLRLTIGSRVHLNGFDAEEIEHATNEAKKSMIRFAEDYEARKFK
jgi:hypothetical protein